ncbi:unnamed protein product [Effrenium voratum]|uniref:Uncharacterized protein n=1 Tax=Effrenium voratum TaxID=2562239 RepID=A0AA36HV04_9DINO|nr:unnamed protein product [Effrenium voratum]
MLAGASIAVNAAVTTRKAVGFLKEVACIEDEGYFLWKLVDSVSAPLEAASRLSTRYEACQVLEPAIELGRFAVRQVELVLERDDDEQQLGRPEDKAGWKAWLMSKTDGLTRKQRILDLQPKLSIALHALHAGLTTVMVQSPLLRPTSPFRYLEAAAEDAYRLLQEMEFGRLPEGRAVASGRLHAGSQLSGWQELGCCEVRVTSAPLALQLRPAQDDSKDWDMVTLPLSRDTFSLQRKLKFQVKAMDCLPQDNKVLTYLMSAQTRRDYLLEFQSVGRLAAETFEALLVMASRTDAGEYLLADSVDLDNLQQTMETLGFVFAPSEQDSL